MRTWIFQANPSRYDLDAWLATNPSEVEWLVSRYAGQIAPGDNVFLWRAAASEQERSGVFAEATAVSGVREIADDGPPEFWLEDGDAGSIKPRVRIAIDRVAGRRDFIRRDWWLTDPILSKHLIITMPNHTTFSLAGDALDRLSQLWANTGRDWRYADALAGLKVYVETLGQQISKLPGSPVSNTALIIGRPVEGVYNKVMNFRALDPSDARAGLDGASQQDKAVFAQFWRTTGSLDELAISREYDRLWGQRAAIDDAAASATVDAETQRLVSSLTLDELLKRWAARAGKRPSQPRSMAGQTRYFERDPIVCAIARKRADNRCEAPGCGFELFVDRRGDRFVEVHHIHRLADGGADVPNNVVCLCPNHHREAHHGQNSDVLIASLKLVRAGDAAQTGSGRLPKG